MEKCLKIANLYIATLRGISIIAQTSHWTTKGLTFYGDHLLFDRIYNSTLELLDGAAEKLIGLFGDGALDYDLQNELLQGVLTKYTSLEGSPLQMTLAVAQDFLKFSDDAYKHFEEEGKLTLGLDDFIMATSSKVEENCYLLKQCLDK